MCSSSRSGGEGEGRSRSWSESERESEGERVLGETGSESMVYSKHLQVAAHGSRDATSPHGETETGALEPGVGQRSRCLSACPGVVERGQRAPAAANHKRGRGSLAWRRGDPCRDRRSRDALTTWGVDGEWCSLHTLQCLIITVVLVMTEPPRVSPARATNATCT